jgi:hypothetical protein
MLANRNPPRLPSRFVEPKAVEANGNLSRADVALRVEEIRLPPESVPLLFVVVDTEEEFDWNARLSRDHTSVDAMKHIGRLHRVFDDYKITPTYVVDFPVASQANGYGALKEYADSEEATIGAHLHPWVNPPFVEEVNQRNSFGFRLGAALETEKIKMLRAQIATSFQRLPVVYKAGRYGFGATTVSALESLNFRIDVSVNPRMSFVSEGGPSFQAFDSTPFFFGRTRILEIPCSTDYTGVCGQWAPAVHRVAALPYLERIRLPGVMAHLGIVNKVMLSPEGATLDEMQKLTRALLKRGVRTFSLTMHSPSVVPGCTPYVRTLTELDDFLACLKDYCEFFFGEIGGRCTTPETFRSSLERNTARNGVTGMQHQELC